MNKITLQLRVLQYLKTPQPDYIMSSTTETCSVIVAYNLNPSATPFTPKESSNPFAGEVANPAYCTESKYLNHQVKTVNPFVDFINQICGYYSILSDPNSTDDERKEAIQSLAENHQLELPADEEAEQSEMDEINALAFGNEDERLRKDYDDLIQMENDAFDTFESDPELKAFLGDTDDIPYDPELEELAHTTSMCRCGKGKKCHFGARCRSGASKCHFCHCK